MMRNICNAEFQRYKSISIALHNIDSSFNNVLAWWKRNATKFPLLATLAHEYLAIPATSAPSERIWSRFQEFSPSRGQDSNQKWHNKLCL